MFRVNHPRIDNRTIHSNGTIWVIGLIISVPPHPTPHTQPPPPKKKKTSPTHRVNICIAIPTWKFRFLSYASLQLCSRIDLLHGITDPKRVFNCLSLNLKLVKIVNFGQGHREFELLRFLLENAKVLEKMIIQAPSIARGEIIRTTKELLSYPRASPRAVILFSEWDCHFARSQLAFVRVIC